MLFNTQCSKTLDTIGSREMGWLFSTCSFAPFLWTGTTLASFQSLGRDPSCSDLLKIVHEEGAITEAVSLSNLAGISSGPVPLLASSALKKTVKQVSCSLRCISTYSWRILWLVSEESETVVMETWPGMGWDLELSFKVDHKRLGWNLKPVSMESWKWSWLLRSSFLTCARIDLNLSVRLAFGCDLSFWRTEFFFLIRFKMLLSIQRTRLRPFSLFDGMKSLTAARNKSFQHR